MKTIYQLTTRVMNGTVTLTTFSSCFLDRDLAEKTKKSIDEKNEGKSVISDISEVILYEDHSEIPILNGDY